eukprot:8805653-Prorocentrum_lima.AAC.1
MGAAVHPFPDHVVQEYTAAVRLLGRLGRILGRIGAKETSVASESARAQPWDGTATTLVVTRPREGPHRVGDPAVVP